MPAQAAKAPSPTPKTNRRIQVRKSGVHGKGVFALQDIPELGGKTGTAEFGDPAQFGGVSPAHGWFAGIAGDIAFATLVVDAGSSAPALTVTGDFLRGARTRGGQGPGLAGKQQKDPQNAHRIDVLKAGSSGQGRRQSPRLGRAAWVAGARRLDGGQFGAGGDQIGLVVRLGGGRLKHGAAQSVAGGHVARIMHGADQATAAQFVADAAGGIGAGGIQRSEGFAIDGADG